MGDRVPATFVIFGASGDLTSRKLIPALYKLHVKGRLPAQTRIVGVSRTEYSHDAWRNELRGDLQRHVGEKFDAEKWNSFAPLIHYSPGDIGQNEDFARLKSILQEQPDGPGDCIFYLATAPRFYEPAAEALGRHGLADQSHGARRIVVEKPFGVDRASATELNARLHDVFDEEQIFRIDHYLGKETVQNLLVFRFANAIFEPLWNRTYIDHVQITVAEEVTVGRRAGYYDQAGVLRDMFQNHLLQLLMITAMETPVRFSAEYVRNEKVKVLGAVRNLSEEAICRQSVRGRYQSYLQEPGAAADGNTATFAALKLNIDNWRWQGVPFYLRSGKGMSCRTTQIVIEFHDPPHMLFDVGRSREAANRLVIQIQPAEGIQLHFQTKVPDAGMKVRGTDLDFRFCETFDGALPDAYERLLLDALQGDASLFARADEVELSWGLIDPILAAWNGPAAPPLYDYELNAWGPVESTAWMREQGREWFDACPVLDCP